MRLPAETCNAATEEYDMEQCKLYALSTCGHCKACKKLLSDCGIQYEFTDVDLLSESERQSVIGEIRELTSR